MNITFNYSIINENNIERKKVLKFFISSLLECNVMVNETISYRSPNKIKSLLHYLKTDHETKISPVGVYSSIGEIDYFAFQRSTKTFKVDFFQELTDNLKNSDGVNERNSFRSFENKEADDEELQIHFNGDNLVNFEPNTKNLNSNKNFIKNAKKIENFPVKKSSETKINTSSQKTMSSFTNLNKEKDSISYETKTNSMTNSKDQDDNLDYPNNSISNIQKFKNLSYGNSNESKLIDFNLEYIYDAKHLIHSVSDFRSTPDFNNITYNYDRFIWNLMNENIDKSEEKIKIELFFDMEESFYSENIYLNLNFTKSIFLLNQTERRAIENSYTKIDSNIMLEFSYYNFADGAVYLMEKVMNSSPDLDKIQYYNKNRNTKNKNDMIKIMKIEAEKDLKFNETFQLEVKFPLYFENCRNYKTNTMIMVTGIVLMVFLGSILYLIVSLNFSDKD